MNHEPDSAFIYMRLTLPTRQYPGESATTSQVARTNLGFSYYITYRIRYRNGATTTKTELHLPLTPAAIVSESALT